MSTTKYPGFQNAFYTTVVPPNPLSGCGGAGESHALKVLSHVLLTLEGAVIYSFKMGGLPSEPGAKFSVTSHGRL